MKDIEISQEMCRAALAVWESAESQAVVGALPVRFWDSRESVRWWTTCMPVRYSLGVYRMAAMEYIAARDGGWPARGCDVGRWWVAFITSGSYVRATYGPFASYDAALLGECKRLLAEEEETTEPAHPAPKFAKGQWFKSTVCIYEITGDPVWRGGGWWYPWRDHTSCKSGAGWWEDAIANPANQPIPPRPTLPADSQYELIGEVRLPKLGEYYVSVYGHIGRAITDWAEAEWDRCGCRRWIARLKATPVQPPASGHESNCMKLRRHEKELTELRAAVTKLLAALKEQGQ